MSRYEVTTFDVCTAGFERLRSTSEFILVASVTPDTTRDDLVSQWMDDLQACDRGDNFDYDAARDCVRDFAPQINTASVLRYVEAPADEDAEGCNAYLFIRDNAAESDD